MVRQKKRKEKNMSENLKQKKIRKIERVTFGVVILEHLLITIQPAVKHIPAPSKKHKKRTYHDHYHPLFDSVGQKTRIIMTTQR